MTPDLRREQDATVRARTSMISDHHHPTGLLLSPSTETHARPCCGVKIGAKITRGERAQGRAGGQTQRAAGPGPTAVVLRTM
jgi:hypothetical protein